MIPRDPLTRYWFINELARTGALASVEDGWITRRLQPQLMEAIAQVIAQCDLRPPQPGEYADRLTLQPTTDPTVHTARRRARKAKQG